MENSFSKCVKTLNLEFPSSITIIEDAVRTTANFVSSLAKSIDSYGLKVVLTEGITNAVVHGNKEDEKMRATVVISLTTELLIIKITDSGDGFDWRKKLDKNLEEDLYSTSGRGIALIRAYGYTIEFNEEGNILTFTKPLDPA